MTKYEIAYILSTQVADEARKESISFVEELLTKNGATNVVTEVLGERKLAYPVKKKEFGYYVFTTFEMDGTKLSEIERRLNIAEDILKYMIVKN